MINDTEKVIKSTCLRTNKAKSLWTSRARYRTSWLEQFLYSPTLFLRLQSHPGKSRPSLLLMWNCSWLKSVTKYWHGCLKVQAGSEVCHCVKETRLVSKIWAPLSPVFYLHWAWMGLKEVSHHLSWHQWSCMDVLARCRCPSLMDQNIWRASRKWTQTTKLSSWT